MPPLIAESASTHRQSTMYQEVKPTSLFDLQMGMGLIPGVSQELKFGRNESIGTTFVEVWDGQLAYGFYPTKAVPVNIKSTTANDVESIQIYGLDSNGSTINEIKILTGVTSIALANNYWCIYRMVNRGSSDNLGVICITAAGTGGGLVTGETAACIRAGFNQTLMALYTIPSGKVAFMTKYSISVDRTIGTPGVLESELRVRPNSSLSVGEVFQIKSHHSININIGNFNHNFKPFFKIAELSDIVLRTEVNQGTADCHADFDLYLVDK